MRTTATRRGLGAFALAAALAIPASSAADGSGRCFGAWLDAWAERAERRIDGPSALLPLRVMTSLAGTAPDPAAVTSVLERLRRTRRADPLVAAYLDRVLLQEDLRRGRVASAATRAARLGTITRYEVAGPFPADVKALPEGASWKEIATGPLGELDLHALISPAAEKAAGVRFRVSVGRRTAAALRLGLSGEGELFADGRLLARFEGPSSARPDQEIVAVDLPAGEHRFTLLLRHDEDPWRLMVRVTDREGRPLPPAPPAPPKAPAKPSRRKVRSAVAELEDSARRGRPVWMARLAVELAARHDEGPRRERAVELVRDALRRAPGNEEVLWAAVLVERDESRRREAIERLLELDPEDPGALRALVRYELRFERKRAARSTVDRAERACGEPDPYLELWRAETELSSGYRAGALARIEEALARWPRHPALLAERASLLREEGSVSQAIAAYREAYEADRLKGDVRRHLYDLLRLAGREGEADELIDDVAAIAPLWIGWRFRRARARLAEGDLEGAGRELAALEKIVLQRADLEILRGEVAFAEGRPEAAVAAWRRALEHGAKSPELADRIAALTGEKGAFDERWTEPLEEIRARIREAPPDLVGDEPAVVAAHTTAYRVRPNGVAERFRQIVYWVRRPEEAASLRRHTITYSPRLQRARVLEARLVRRDGTVVHATREDRALLPDLQLRTWYDTRVIELAFPRLDPGDLVELRYRVDDRGPANPIAPGCFGDIAVLGSAAPTLSARLVIEASETLPVRYALSHAPPTGPPRTEKKGGWTTTVISLPPLPAHPDEPGAPPPLERLPHAILSTVSSWEELAGMYARLIEEQIHGGPDIESLVRRITRGRRSRREVIRAIYDWVIENTRYVALELGIHSLKPYDVTDVLRRRHGDCKDKAGLMVAMLEEAGVDADIALLRTRGNGSVDTTLPLFSVFDHAIVRVPDEDLWLDGTVLHHGMGELPIPDRGGLALVVDDETGSGRLVTTPPAEPGSDVTNRRERVVLGPDGSAHVEATVEARGEAAARARARFRLADNRKGSLQALLRRDWPDAVVETAQFPRIGLDDEVVRYGFEAAIPRYGTVRGSRLNVPLAARLPALPSAPPGPRRTQALRLPDPFEREVRSDLELPDGCRAVETPGSTSVDSEWGTLEIDVTGGEREVTVTARHVFRGGTVPAGRLEEFRRYVTAVREALTQRIAVACGDRREARGRWP
ncbi:MAG: DUF3857 domain-containing protein [Acidobacteria bacterium]|nr:MAG: DUF3857 domain-containing protein [Acidobacteriota bacterium]